MVHTKHSFIFNGKSSLDYGIIIATHPESRHAERRGSTSTIPGRHGALFRDEAAFSTYEISYDVLLDARNVGDMYHIGRDISAWLLTANGYCRLEDTYEPEHYRMVRYVGSPDVANILFKFGRAELEFEVQPQRYLKSGEKEIVITDDGVTLYNPTAQEAYPLIKLDMWDTNPEQRSEEAVELTWTEGKYIASRQGNSASKAYRVQDSRYASSVEKYVSQQIDLDGVEEVIVSAYASNLVINEKIVEARTCYTFLNASGVPVKGNKDAKLLRDERITVPTGAKYLAVSGMRSGITSTWEKVTPSVTLVKVTGGTLNGDLTINDQSVVVEDSPRPVIYLDCDRHDAYFEDGSNANSYVEFTELDNLYPTFPKLSPGSNLLTTSGNGVKVTFWPRWWTL